MFISAFLGYYVVARRISLKLYSIVAYQTMNKTFRQQYKQKQQIENSLAHAWGYNVANTSIELKQKKHIENARPNVANITLRKFGKEIEKTEKMKEIQDEIRGIQNQRMIRQLKQSKFQQACLEEKSQVINLMENIIEDYNNIIQHKHITSNIKPKHEEKNHVYLSQRKRQHQRLIEEINNKKKSLLKADLKEQIKINKEIAKLYRQYNQMQNNLSSISLKNNRSIAPQIPFTYKTMKKHQSQTFDRLEELATVQNLNKFISLKMSNSDENLRQMVKIFRKNSDIGESANDLMIKKFKELQMKKYSASNRRMSVNLHNSVPYNSVSNGKKAKRIKKNSLQKDITQPFLDKKQVEQYSEMEKKIKSNSEALQLWKSKINDVSHNSRIMRRAQRIKEINRKIDEKERQQREEQIEHALEKSIDIMSVQSSNANNLLTQQLKGNQRKHQIQKQKIFAELLRKKNNKFNKLWGTKILVKYDSQKYAKSMLKGALENNPRKIKSSQSHRRGFSFTSRTADINVSKMNKTQQAGFFSARENIYGRHQSELSWKTEQQDEEHYWRMCKNEKINLLLKRR